MGGFTKLVPEIIQSSIWNESPEVRCVWIALLALKDENGYVRGDPQTLSRLANIPHESVREALDKFSNPDPLSHTPDNDGRRIEQAAGGWIVLNHELYRVGDRNEYMRDYMRKRRAKQKDVNSVNINDNNSSVSVSASDSASKEGESEWKGKRGKMEPHGEFSRVKLSADEYRKLTEKHGKDRADAGIAELDAWIERTGKRRKNHYACLNESSWVWEKVHGKAGMTKPANQPMRMFELKAMLEQKEVEWEQSKASGKWDTDAGRKLKRRVKELRKQIGGYGE